ncbi:3-deoxy-D-manno-octulosonate 8-phosphate phosphatase [hydrothermal vent metagenome]|uniref:3-deoxy-D-manno-octulosonate 8-phosphate phosphatase KdsC n=1 Tax=hydrothermal vent metagenome TaxID=652676 RepID=A0A3B0Y845_9ZZZZ
MQDILEKAAKIKLVIFDIDGVLTSGALFIGDDGQEYKAFNSKDGHGLRMLQDGGVKVAIITGRQSEVVNHRAKDLGITLIYQGRREKLPAYEQLLAETGLTHEEIAYVGDDVVDLPVMSRVGLAICVNNGHDFVKKHSHWVTQLDGGNGAGREVCEMLLESRGQLQQMLQAYLK